MSGDRLLMGADYFIKKQYFLAREFIKDCHVLIADCGLLPEINWESFLKLLFEKGFDDVFMGRKQLSDTVDFAEQCVVVAKEFFLKSNLRYRDRVTVTFLMYVLLKNQPINCFSFIWLTIKDKPVFLEFEKEARERNDHEVLYCLGNLCCDGNVKVTGTAIEHGLTRNTLHYHSYFIKNLKQTMIHEDFMTPQEIYMLNELPQLAQDYASQKKIIVAYAQKRGEKETLTYVKPEFFNNLCVEFMKLQCHTTKERPKIQRKYKTHAENEYQKTSDGMEERKMKAMKSLVGSPNYLRSIEEFHSEEPKKPVKRLQVKPKPVKSPADIFLIHPRLARKEKTPEE